MIRPKITLVRPPPTDQGCMLCLEKDKDKLSQIDSICSSYYIVLCEVCCRIICRKMRVDSSDSQLH